MVVFVRVTTPSVGEDWEKNVLELYFLEDLLEELNKPPCPALGR
jgi:hypothetical protein